MRMLPKTSRKIDASHLEKCEEEEEPVCRLRKRGQETRYRLGCCSINYRFCRFKVSKLKWKCRLWLCSTSVVCPNCCSSLSFDLKSYIFSTSNHIGIDPKM